MAAIAGLPRLEYLDLEATRVGDAALRLLREAKGLRDLVVKNTNVTDGGIADLREA